MVKLNKFHLFAALTCVYAVFIFYLSSLASPPSPSEFGFLFGLVRILEDLGFEFLMYPFYVAYRYPDKFAHMLLYLGFGLLLNQTLSRSKSSIMNKYAVPIALGLGTFYAVTDEIHQAFVPYRTASSMDLYADFLGLILAQLLILMYISIKRWLA
jgi:VanZ family protein